MNRPMNLTAVSSPNDDTQGQTLPTASLKTSVQRCTNQKAAVFLLAVSAQEKSADEFLM